MNSMQEIAAGGKSVGPILLPLKAALVSNTVAQSTRNDGEFNHRAVAEQIVTLCCQVLRGGQALSSLRRMASPVAFRQFSSIHRRLWPELQCSKVAFMRVSRSTVSADGTIEIVATIHIGSWVRAIAMQAHYAPPTQWRLTVCDLIGGY